MKKFNKKGKQLFFKCKKKKTFSKAVKISTGDVSPASTFFHLWDKGHTHYDQSNTAFAFSQVVKEWSKY